MIDYNAVLLIAQQLVSDNGRDVVFNRIDDTVADANRPWEGNVPTPVESVTLRAVAVQPSSAVTLGLRAIDQDLLKRTSAILIVAGQATFDMTEAHSVVDEGVTRRVSFVEQLRPSTVTMLHFVGVER